MSDSVYLSYSSQKLYTTCPKKYRFKYILKDRTRGDASKTILGHVLGKLFEWFYSKKIWMYNDPAVHLLSLVDEAKQLIIDKEDSSLRANSSFMSSLNFDLNKFIIPSLEVIRQNKLVTPMSVSEIDLTSICYHKKYSFSLKMGGRADFIHGHDLNDIWIIDGKASKHREKYVDAEQLIWYSTQFYLKYHSIPTRLGFLFYCFPDDPIKWISYDDQSVRDLLDKTFDIANKVKLAQFDASPSGECHRCEFRSKCDDGKKYIIARRKETGGVIEDSIFDLETVK